MSKRLAWGALRVAPLVAMLGVAGTAAAAVVSAQGMGGGSAVLRTESGQTVGTAIFTEVGGGVRITLQARDLPPGRHGIHIHAVGLCEAPAFTSAGAHFNPTNRQHGLNNPAGPHAGDLPELVVAANGTANYAATNRLVTLAPGPTSLFDADGSALVVHADPDDQMTDPSGNSGARIACGTLVRGAAALPRTGQARPHGWAASTSMVEGSGGPLLALLGGAGALALGILRAARRRATGGPAPSE